MNEQEAIRLAEVWYLWRYHAVASGHIALDAEGEELRDAQFLCIDLLPERGTEVVNVIVDLTRAEQVALLDEGVPCPRCTKLRTDRRGVVGQEAETGGEQERSVEG